MKEIDLEMLAELLDREPTEAEGRVLEERPDLKQELDALRAQTEALGRLPSLRPPRGDWAALEAKLMSEGLIRSRQNTWLTLPMTARWTKVAAAVILFAGGSLSGAAFARGTIGGSIDSASSATTLRQAERAVEAAEQQYLNSLVRYRELSASTEGPSSIEGPAERSAALDLLVRASQNALLQAPDDPFINLFLVNTLAEQRASARRPRGQDNWF